MTDPTRRDQAQLFGSGMPLPNIEPHSAPFWEGCNHERFLVQRCASCDTHRFPPRPVCWRCSSFDYEWDESAGRGDVFTYTIVHHTPHPVAAAAIPYNISVVQLDDCGGPLVTSNVLDAGNALRVGMRVRLVWDASDARQTVYRFRPDP